TIGVGFAGPDLHRRIILPFVGIADLRAEKSELLERAPLGLLAHPRHRADAFAIGAAHVLDEFERLALGFGGKMPRDVDLADGFAQRVVNRLNGALPAFALLLLAVQRLAV